MGKKQAPTDREIVLTAKSKKSRRQRLKTRKKYLSKLALLKVSIYEVACSSNVFILSFYLGSLCVEFNLDYF